MTLPTGPCLKDLAQLNDELRQVLRGTLPESVVIKIKINMNQNVSHFNDFFHGIAGV